MKTQNKFQKILILLSLFLLGSIVANAQGDEPGIKPHSDFSLLLAPAGISNPQLPVSAPDLLSRGANAYGNNLQLANFYMFDIDDPLNTTVIGPADYLAYGGDFSSDDPDNMWIIDYLDDSLKTVDITTGLATYVADFPCPLSESGGIWTSLAIHKITNDFFAMATDGTQSILYGFDPQTGAIKTEFDLGLLAGISSSFDASGALYVLDIASDSIYVVDVGSGGVLPLGGAGFNANYGQGMGYDAAGDEVYLAAYENLVGSQLRSLDRFTGMTTLLASLPGETGAFGFPVTSISIIYHSVTEVYTDPTIVDGDTLWVLGDYTNPDDSLLVNSYHDLLKLQVWPPHLYLITEGVQPPSEAWNGGWVIAKGTVQFVINPDPYWPEDSLTALLDIFEVEVLINGSGPLPKQKGGIIDNEDHKYEGSRECDSCKFAILIGGAYNNKSNESEGESMWESLVELYKLKVDSLGYCEENVFVPYYNGVGRDNRIPPGRVIEADSAHIADAHAEVSRRVANCTSNNKPATFQKMVYTHGTADGSGSLALRNKKSLGLTDLKNMQQKIIDSCCTTIYDEFLQCNGGYATDEMSTLDTKNKATIYANSAAGYGPSFTNPKLVHPYLHGKINSLKNGNGYGTAVVDGKKAYDTHLQNYIDKLKEAVQKLENLINDTSKPETLRRRAQTLIAAAKKKIAEVEKEIGKSKNIVVTPMVKYCQWVTYVVPPGGQLVLKFKGDKKHCGNVTVNKIGQDGKVVKEWVFNWNIEGSFRYDPEINNKERRVNGEEDESTTFKVHNDDGEFTITAEMLGIPVGDESQSNVMAFPGFSHGGRDWSNGEFTVMYEPEVWIENIDQIPFDLSTLPAIIGPDNTMFLGGSFTIDTTDIYASEIEHHLDIDKVFQPGILTVGSSGSLGYTDVVITEPGEYNTPLGDFRSGSANAFIEISTNGASVSIDSEGVHSVYEPNIPEINAGPDTIIMAGEPFVIVDATASNFGSLIWTTGGDGVFDDSTALNPTYIPGDLDNGIGAVELCLTGTPLPPWPHPEIDCMYLYIELLPTVDAGVDQTICEDGIAQLYATAENYSALLWTGGAGTFSATDILDPTYTPDASEYGTTVTLCIEAMPISPCTISATDCMDVFILLVPSIDILPYQDYVCYYEVFDFTGLVVADNYDAIQWFTLNGSGYFDDETILEPTYYPSMGDYSFVCIIIVVSAYPLDPCVVTAEDYMDLCFQPPVEVDAGTDVTVPAGEDYHLAEPSAINYSAVLWTGGAGVFSATYILDPIYTPDPSEYGTTVTLCIEALPIYPCTVPAFDFMELTILPATTLSGFVLDSLGNPIPVEDMYISAHPWCFPSDTLCISDGTIEYWVDEEGGHYELDYSSFENPPEPGDLVEIFFINTSQAPLQDHAEETVEIPLEIPIQVNIEVKKVRNLHFPQTPCTWYEIEIPPGKTAKLDYSDVDGCGNTTVQRWNGTSWEYYKSWNFNYRPPNSHREIENAGTGLGKVRLHNDNTDADGFAVAVTIDPPAKQTSPDNREEFATISLGGGDGFSCEFGNIVATDYIFNFEQGALLSDFPGTLGTGGVENLEIRFESYDNIYWNNMCLQIRLLNVNEPTTLHLDIPDATIPQTSVDILPGDTICFLYPGGIPDVGMHTMSLYLEETDSFSIFFVFDAFNFSSLIPILPGYDFGDAPDSPYPTLLASDGARHLNDGVTFLGNLIDDEDDGLQSPDALGDDNNNLDDEDGVVFIGPMVAGSAYIIKVNASVDGILNTWLDYDINGNWGDAGEHIFNDEPLSAGWNSLTFNIPAGASVGKTFIRFRFDTQGGLSYSGSADNGEVEDYMVNLYPVGWGYIPTPDNHLITVPFDVNLIGITLAANDVLGVFYTDGLGNMACGGAQIYDGVNNQVVLAYGNDGTTTEKDGFDGGEELKWKVYLTASGEEQWLNVEYDPLLPNHDGTFVSGGLSALTSIIANCQELVMFQGWSGISSYIVPDDPDLEDMFNFPEFIILQNFDGYYWPPTNTLGDWDEYSGYWIKVSGDVTLDVCGFDVTNKTVNLDAQWNIIPVFSKTPVDAATFLGGVAGFKVAKEVAGPGVLWPYYGVNTLYNLKPGKSYFVYMTTPGSVTYTSKAENINPEKPFEFVNITPWNDVLHSPGTHLVAFSPEMVSLFEEGDFIGAFTPSGLCAGMTVVTEIGLGLALNSDDVYTDISDGFVSGESIAYKLYRPATKQTFDLEIEYEPTLDNSGQFHINGLSAIIDVSLTGIDTPSGSGIMIYPNPSAGIFNIEGIDGEAEITIFNAFGEEVLYKEMILPGQVDLTGQPKGVYFIRISSDKGSYFSKLLVD